MNVVDANENKPLQWGKHRKACKDGRDVQGTGVGNLGWPWRKVGSSVIVLDKLGLRSMRSSCFLDVRHGGVGGGAGYTWRKKRDVK